VSRGILAQYINGEVDRTALEQKLATLQAAKAELKTRIAAIPAKQQGLTAVTRQREESSASLKSIQTKLEEARVAEAQLISNIRIVDRAVAPKNASSPQQPVILAVAITAGLILAVALALLLERLDNTLHHSKELSALTHLRVLATLPKLPFKPTYGRLDAFLDQSRLVEPYRMLLKTLDRRLSTQPNASKIILISSVMEGEGKSNLVTYLAAVAATLSYRTLVIDTDSTQAMQQGLLGVPSTPGVSDAIVRKTPLQEVIKPTAIDNLYLMPYGELPKRPATVMESPDMAKLLETVGQDFDLVIIDTAVLSRSVDAVTLIPHVSGLLLTTRPEHTRRDLLKQLLLDLQDNHIEPLGLVVNHNADIIARTLPTIHLPPPRPIEALPDNAPYPIR
jgi:polysaccharide biosynthesis transport protein